MRSHPTVPTSRVRASSCSLLLALAVGGCAVQSGDLGDQGDTEGESSTGGGSTTAQATSDGSSGTGEPLCTPGEIMNGLCGNYCECQQDGTWACSDKGCAAIGPGFEQSLVTVGGCADMEMFANDVDGTIALHVVAPGLVAEAKAAGMPLEKTLALTDPALTAEILTGAGLISKFCNDVVVESTIDLTYLPIAGTVTFTVTPAVDPEVTTASAVLTDVVWKIKDAPDSEPVPMPSFTIDSVPVGWLPG